MPGVQSEALSVICQAKLCQVTKLRFGLLDNVRIFGSIARGDAQAQSDVDFLVNLEPHQGLLERIALIQDLETLLDRKVDVATETGLHWYIRERVLKEAVPL